MSWINPTPPEKGCRVQGQNIVNKKNTDEDNNSVAKKKMNMNNKQSNKTQKRLRNLLIPHMFVYIYMYG